MIGKGNIIDFFETKIYFLSIEPGFVHGGAHVFDSIVDKVFDGIDVG